ncbi:hypothetical protein L195_g010209 [Trifolium pratense]|uniref:Retrovirus-related Pol polyprotein from transposon TNT 1-94-like beta-barrel domain-containing protein n=1 Tax=Trifolium pratense TaxID=57577 RepID=A0A2K3PE42_TRIPR|nr:hypothetical protein L195_g010209 [Trifolium pratense]
MVRPRASSSNMDETPAFPTLSDPSQNPSISMMKAVRMKNKLRFLDGTCPMPDRLDPSYEPWISCNNLVLSWLMNSVIPAISQTMQNAKKFREEDLILLFLTGLNDNHQPSAAINFTRQAYGKGSIPPKSDKKCTYCHKNNHVVDNCFRKHGSGYRFKDGTVVGIKGQGQASANYVDSVDFELKDQVDNRMATFSTEEYQALTSLLKSSTKLVGKGPSQVHNVTRCVSSSYSDKQGTNPNSLDMWILDSGATYHACASLSLFTAYKEVPPILVKLPNWSIVSTNIIGNINITSQLTLKNVLYMPHFSFNLIPVSRVTSDLDCVFAFTDTLCFIQNSMQKMIGSGRLINGLYYLEGTQSQSSLPTAKQRKLPYDLSNNRASSCLELLHMDIWGPFATPTPHGHNHDNLSPSYSSYCLPLLTNKEPASYAEASKHDYWTKAMQHELTALANNNTWIMVDLP